MFKFQNIILITIIYNKKRKLKKKKYTPLHYAVEWKKKEMVEFLLLKGADIDATDIIILNITILF